MNEQQIETNGLPGRYYTDPAILDHELEAHFINGWVSIGSVQMVPNAGDTYPLTVAGRPLLVTRDREGEVHVFNNVCRHRGTRLISEPCNRGNGLITCPYHAWGYKLDGKLITAPFTDLDDTSKAVLGLLPVRMGVFVETIFVNLSDTAQPFEEFIQPLVERWAEFDFSLLRLATQKMYHTECNWKLLAESYIDTLHVMHVHPQFAVDNVTKHKHEFNRFSHDLFNYYSPTLGGTMADAMPFPMFPDGPQGFKTRFDMTFLFPNTTILFVPSFVQINTLQPVGPGAVTNETFGYLIGDEALTQEQEVEKFAEMVRVTNLQDTDVLNSQQAGRVGNATDVGVMLPYWDQQQARLLKRIAECYDDN